MIAASHGHLEMCKLLVEAKAVVHKRKNFAATPLHMACRGMPAAYFLNGEAFVNQYLLQGVTLTLSRFWLKAELICHKKSWINACRYTMPHGAEIAPLCSIF